MSSDSLDAVRRAELARRRNRRVAARRRGLLRLAVLLAVVFSACGYGISTAFGGPARSNSSAPGAASHAIVAVESGVETWSLPAPVARAVVLRAAVPGKLVVAGGLLSTGASSAAVDLLNPISGSMTPLGQLAAAAHDAAGALIRGRGYVFGGGSAAPSSVIQRIGSLGVPLSRADGIVARLPSARADAAAVTIGTTTYLVGGYGGTSADRGVLATNDGIHFHSVARLARRPLPSRRGDRRIDLCLRRGRRRRLAVRTDAHRATGQSFERSRQCRRLAAD